MNRRILTLVILVVLLTINTCFLYGQNNQMPSFVDVIANGTLEQVLEVINDTPDINAEINDLGWTPLHAAISFRNGDLATMLIMELDADIDAQDNSGNTPLMLAIQTGQFSAAQFLIENGANVNITNNSGDNSLSIAQKIGLDNIGSLLEQNDAQLPGQAQRGRGNRIGMPGMNVTMPEGIMNRRGPGGNNMVQDFTDEQEDIDRPEPVNRNNVTVSSGNLDPNEVKARIDKFEGLAKEVLDVADGKKSELRQWERTDRDNRTSLISAIRKQYQTEVRFIKKIATEEKAQKTSELADKYDDSRKDAFVAINRVVRDEGTTSSRTTTSRTNTNTRRTTGRTTATTTRTNRRGSTTQETSTQEESKYPPEIQAEVDIWLRADITGISGRLSLMDTVNETIISEINTIKQTASQENAEKTLAAIDGLLVDRQIKYDELKQTLRGEEEEMIPDMPDEMMYMEDMPEYDEPEMMNNRGMNRGQMPTGRGMRGR